VRRGVSRRKAVGVAHGDGLQLPHADRRHRRNLAVGKNRTTRSHARAGPRISARGAAIGARAVGCPGGLIARRSRRLRSRRQNAEMKLHFLLRLSQDLLIV